MSTVLLNASPQDKRYLFELRLLTMVDHLTRAGICLSVDEHWARVNECFDAHFLIIHDAVRVGAVKYRDTSTTLNIMQLQIHPDYQGRGIGRTVLSQMIVRTTAPKITLTVLKANPARTLYQRLGFRVTGEDPFEFHMEKSTDSCAL